STGRTQGRTELVRKRIQNLEVLGTAQAATAGHHYRRTGQFGTIALGELTSDKGRLAGVRHCSGVLDGRAAAFGRGGIECRGTHSDDLDTVAGLNGRDRKSTRLNSSH